MPLVFPYRTPVCCAIMDSQRKGKAAAKHHTSTTQYTESL